MSTTEPYLQRARTKIVATVGPASADFEVLMELVTRGVDVFRLNMAHGDRAEHQLAIENIRRASQTSGRPVGILVDLAGPKIRLGDLPAEMEGSRTGHKRPAWWNGRPTWESATSSLCGR